MNSSMVAAIDAWAQPMMKVRLPEVERLFEQSGTSAWLPSDLDADGIVKMMDAAGVNKLMLCAWCRPGQWLVTNDEIAQYVNAYPDRFVGVAAVAGVEPALGFFVASLEELATTLEAMSTNR